MTKNKIWIVDAFAYQPYTGNPAAVMIVGEFPKQAANIAREMNLSETVFVEPLVDNRFNIRWLTPTTEVKLCGHATLAAAHILFEQNMITGDQVFFESLSGPLSAKRSGEYLIIDLPIHKVEQQLDKSLFEQFLGLEGKIIEVVKAGDDVIVNVAEEYTIRDYQPDFTKIMQIEALSVILTSISTEFDFISRCFAPRDGINEDPVTGSAHCALADYWAKILDKTHFRAYQASARGGIVEVEIQDKRVLLKGAAITTMEGELFLC